MILLKIFTYSKGYRNICFFYYIKQRIVRRGVCLHIYTFYAFFFSSSLRVIVIKIFS